jgi:Ca2+-transporting ATPase
MGLTTFAISNVVFSLTTRDERRSVFSLDLLGDRTFLMCTGGSIAAIVLGTEFSIFQRVLHTVHLTGHQWLICIVVGLAIIPVSEARRLLLQRRRPAVATDDEPQDARPAASTSS